MIDESFENCQMKNYDALTGGLWIIILTKLKKYMKKIDQMNNVDGLAGGCLDNDFDQE